MDRAARSFGIDAGGRQGGQGGHIGRLVAFVRPPDEIFTEAQAGHDLRGSRQKRHDAGREEAWVHESESIDDHEGRIAKLQREIYQLCSGVFAA